MVSDTVNKPNRELKVGSLKRKKVIDNIAGYLFLTPAMVGFLLFIGGPILMALIFSFFEYNLIQSPTFVGFDNFRRLFDDRLTGVSFVNTFRFLAILVPIHCGLGLMLAYLVYRTRRLQFFFRSAIYFPAITTTASVAIIWGFLFSTDLGIVNFYVRFFGGTNIPWMTSTTFVYFTIALFSFWKFIGVTFLYYFIGLKNIPDVYYEAASIDGASNIQTFFKITMPLLTPTIFFVVVTNVIGVFQIFDEPFLLTEGGPGDATRTVALQIYETAFRQMRIGYGATVSLALFVIIMAITILQFMGQRRWVNYDYE